MAILGLFAVLTYVAAVGMLSYAFSYDRKRKD